MGPQPKKLILPSDEYVEYEKKALKWLQQWGNIHYTGSVRIDAFYWLPDRRSRPDLVGLMQATGDILEKAGIIDNDRNIVSWGESRIMGVSKQKPRVDITITTEL